jgi:hypothetical protein
VEKRPADVIVQMQVRMSIAHESGARSAFDAAAADYG